MKAVIIGAGSWGTALALIIARNGHEVVLMGRDQEHLDEMERDGQNARYLPDAPFPESVSFALEDGEVPASDLLVSAVPSDAFAETLPINPNAPQLLIAGKGLGPNGELLSEQVPAGYAAEVAVLSGPNLAAELAKGIPTVAVIASEQKATAEAIRPCLASRAFRVYVNSDMRGVQLAGALKNVMAIAGGISDGLGYGNNTKGALLARGLGEIARLGEKMGARLDTFLGIAGVGDLFATAASQLSRNYRVGRGVGEGRDLVEVLEKIGQVAEGVGTSEAAAMLAKRHGVDCPIINVVAAILRGDLAARDGVGQLMSRELTHEGLSA